MTQDSSRLRLGVLGMVVLSLFCALLARLWYLQVLASPTFKVEAQHNSVAVVYTEAPRGRILDRNGKVLADNRVVLALVGNREEIAKKPEVLDRLSGLLNVPVPVLQERIADERYSLFKPVPVALDVPKDKLIYVREHQWEFPGIEGVQLTERWYPNGTHRRPRPGHRGGDQRRGARPPQGPGLQGRRHHREVGHRARLRDRAPGRPRDRQARGRLAGPRPAVAREPACGAGRRHPPQHRPRHPAPGRGVAGPGPRAGPELHRLPHRQEVPRLGRVGGGHRSPGRVGAGHGVEPDL